MLDMFKEQRRRQHTRMADNGESVAGERLRSHDTFQAMGVTWGFFSARWEPWKVVGSVESRQGAGCAAG